jgi:hypothetical protein
MTMSELFVGVKSIAGALAAVGRLFLVLKEAFGFALNESGQRTAKTLTAYNWEGCVEEIDTDGKYTNVYQVDWVFFYNLGSLMCKSTAREITGRLAPIENYKLKVRIKQERLFQMDYTNEDIHQIHFGTEILRLNLRGDKFSGKFAGFANDRNTIISGRINGVRKGPK